MIRKLLLVMVALLAIGSGWGQGVGSKGLNALLARRGFIRIGLSSPGKSVTINAPSGATLMVDGGSAKPISGPMSVTSTGGGVSVSGGGANGIQGRSLEFAAPPGSGLSYNGKLYRGRFVISGTSALKVVNFIMIDDWLKGVLPAEIGSDSPIEALKAQAVAGRSEAIFRLNKPPHESDGYDFCTGVHCQAYKGVSEENPAIVKACDETLGVVMVINNDVLNAVYHNVCGGVTAGAEEVWDSKPIPGLSPVFDQPGNRGVNLSSEEAVREFLSGTRSSDFCYPGNPDYANYAKKYFRWSKTMSASELGSAAGVGTVTDITVTQRMASGRVRKLTVTGTRGSKTFDKELNIRNVFDLWSGLFVVDIQKAGNTVGQVTFKGAGNGHGVGLCQHGAREMARRGIDFSQILMHYYPGASPKKIYRP